VAGLAVRFVSDFALQEVARGFRDRKVIGASDPCRLQRRSIPRDHINAVRQQGEIAYKTYCESCHGPSGRGGQKGSAITDDSFLALVSDQELRTVVIVGRPELGAPDWRGKRAWEAHVRSGNHRCSCLVVSRRAHNPGSHIQTRRSATLGASRCRMKIHSPPRVLHEDGNLVQRLGSNRVGRSRSCDFFSPLSRVGARTRTFLGAARAVSKFSRRRDAFWHVSKSLRDATDGKTVDTACWVRRVEGINSRYLQSTVRILGCPVRWFPQSGLFMCRATAGVLPRRFACFRSAGTRPVRISYKVQNGSSPSKQVSCPHRGHRLQLSLEGSRRAPPDYSGREWFDRRLQLAAPIREVSEHPVPRNTASWWYVFGSAVSLCSFCNSSPESCSR